MLLVALLSASFICVWQENENCLPCKNYVHNIDVADPITGSSLTAAGDGAVTVADSMSFAASKNQIENARKYKMYTIYSIQYSLFGHPGCVELFKLDFVRQTV